MDVAKEDRPAVFGLPLGAVAVQPSAARRFGVSVLAVAAMSAIRLSLTPVLGHSSPYLLFTPAVMVAAWYGGLWPGILAISLSTAVGTRFLRPSVGGFPIEDWDRLSLFVVVGMAVTWLQVTVAASTERIGMLLTRERAARAEAEAADRAKDDFLATISHELRGPLTVVIGWASLLREHALDLASVRKAADVIERNAQTQERLVEDIVDSVRASRGTMRLERRRLDLASLVAAVVDATRPAAERLGIAVQVTIPPGESAVWGDPVRLHQVLSNILNNAVKFNRKGGAIAVRLDHVNDRACITVMDTGAGIEADFLPHVFEPFKKRHASTQGLGLGLAIVRHLVEAHGGHVGAASPGRGQGSTFTLSLPLMPPRDAAGEAPPCAARSSHAVRRSS